MKKRNYIALGALVAMAALSSCGGGGSTVVDQDLPKDDPKSEVTINFWHCLGQAKTDKLDVVIEKFNTDYAGKYKVVATALAGGYDELHETLKKKLADGKVPGLTMGYPDSFSEYISKKMSNSSILRLNNWLTDEEYGYSQSEIDDFVPGYYAEGTGYQFDGTWSMPMYKSTEVMYYNLDMFNGFNEENDHKFKNDTTYNALKILASGAEVKITDEEYVNFVNYVKTNNGYTYEVPESWQDMVAVGRNMIANRAAEKLPASAWWPVGYDSDANLMISQMKMRNIPYTANGAEAQADKSKHFLFNNPEAKALATELKGLIEDKVLITKGKLGGKTYTNTYFTAGQIAMTIGSTGGSSYNISSNFHVEIAPVPCWKDGEGVIQKNYIQQGPSICFFDNENPYIHKGSWLFYKYLANPENNCSLALENSYDPVRISSYDPDPDSIYSKWCAKKDLGIQYKIPTVTSTLKANYFTSDTFVGSATAREQIGDILNMICNQQLSVDQAFEAAYNTCIYNA